MKKYISLIILFLMLITSINVTAGDIPTAVGTFTCDQNKVYVGDTFYVTFWVDTNFETDAVTARQIKWTEHADLLYQGGKAAIFLDPWNTSMVDDGDLQEQGNLTYLMVFDIEGQHYGNLTVFQMHFMAKENGTFELWVPNIIDYGPAKGQPGLDVAFADNSYTNVFSLQVGEEEENGGSNGGNNGGGNNGGGGGGYKPPKNYPPTAVLPTKYYNATCNCPIYTHVYTKLGNFTVKLMVKDEEYLTHFTTTNVWVQKPFVPDEPDEPNNNGTDIPDNPEPNGTDIPDNNQTKNAENNIQIYVYILIGIIIVLAIITILKRRKMG